MKKSATLIANKLVEKIPAQFEDGRRTMPEQEIRDITFRIDVNRPYLNVKIQLCEQLAFIIGHDKDYNPKTKELG